MYTKSFVIAALVSSEVSAVTLQYRPTQGSVPWVKAISRPDFLAKPDFPINYTVPNFGVDQDIINVSSSLQNTEKRMNKKLHASFDMKKSPLNPRGYKVPDFGVDRDIIWTKNSLKQAEKSTGKKFTLNKNNKAVGLAQGEPMPAVAANGNGAFGPGTPEYSSATGTFTKEQEDAQKAALAKARAPALPEPVAELAPATKKAEADQAVKKDEKKKEAAMSAPADKAAEMTSPKAEEGKAAKAAPIAKAAIEISDGSNVQLFSQNGIAIHLHDDPNCPSSGCPKQEWVLKNKEDIVQYPVDIPLTDEVTDSIANEKEAAVQVGHTWKIPQWR